MQYATCFLHVFASKWWMLVCLRLTGLYARRDPTLTGRSTVVHCVGGTSCSKGVQHKMEAAQRQARASQSQEEAAGLSERCHTMVAGGSLRQCHAQRPPGRRDQSRQLLPAGQRSGRLHCSAAGRMVQLQTAPTANCHEPGGGGSRDGKETQQSLWWHWSFEPSNCTQ